jgi:glycosyltransferase involved in cell wall biosynthesis
MHVGVVLDDIEPQAGGGFTFVHDIAAALLDHAKASPHRFTLLVSQAYADAMHGRELVANVSIVPSRKPRFLERRISLLRHYVPVVGYLWKSVSGLERQMASLGVDLVWIVAGRLKDTFEIPYVTTVWDVQHLTHPWFPEVSANWRWDHRELFLWRHLRRATSIIVGTQVGKDEIVRYYGVPEEHIAILPHPTPSFVLRAAEETATDKLPSNVPKDYLLYPAQFWPHKNHVNLLKALRLLVEADPATPALVLAGSDQGNRAFVERCAADLGVSHKVHFLGFVPTEDLIRLYRNARALVYPSFSGPENLPPLEAFALGCPAIVSNYRGAEEQLGDCAMLFDPTKPAAIAEAIARVVTDEQLRAQLIERGKKRAASWTGREFVGGIFKIFDAFAAQRCCWK